MLDGSVIIATIMVNGQQGDHDLPDYAQLQQLATSQTMLNLYQLALEDGMTLRP